MPPLLNYFICFFANLLDKNVIMVYSRKVDFLSYRQAVIGKKNRKSRVGAVKGWGYRGNSVVLDLTVIRKKTGIYMNKILVTGVTGLVGSAFVVALLREREDYEIVCLVRRGGGKTAAERAESIIRDECAFDGCPEIADRILKKISVVEGDVTSIEPETLAKDEALKGVDIIFHCAADVNLGKDPTGKVFKINYHGTENMVALAKLLNAKEFHYVGTAYIAGKLQGTAIEDNPIDSGFNNPYEESKFKAEFLVRNSGIPFSVYRPAIVTGRRGS